MEICGKAIGYLGRLIKGLKNERKQKAMRWRIISRYLGR